LRSTATWKVVISDVPMSIPTGSVAFGRDAFANGEPTNATGFERELRDLLLFLDRNNVKNVVFVTTDVHFAEAIRYRTDVDADGDSLVLHELVSGRVNAARGTSAPLDPTFGPTGLYAEGNLFNFGYARLAPGSDGRMHLLTDVRGENGQPRPGSAIGLTPQ
jgi:alkaline phosphatase D